LAAVTARRPRCSCIAVGSLGIPCSCWPPSSALRGSATVTVVSLSIGQESMVTSGHLEVATKAATVRVGVVRRPSGAATTKDPFRSRPSLPRLANEGAIIGVTVGEDS
jgi:hypothetical protein